MATPNAFQRLRIALIELSLALIDQETAYDVYERTVKSIPAPDPSPPRERRRNNRKST